MITININSKKLLTALQKCQKAVSQNRIVPATENFRLTGADGNIHVSACNTEVSLETDITAEFDNPFDVLLPANKTLDFIKKLADQPITISIDETNHITIKHNSGSAKMQGESGGDFPRIETVNGVKFGISDLQSALYSVAYARGLVDDPRPFVYSIWLEVDKKECRLIAGDGHVVANYKLDGKFQPVRVLLPFNVSNILLSIPGDAEVDISKDSITAIIGDLTIKSRLIDATWPDWKTMVPTPEQTSEVNKTQLLASLDRVISFANQATKLVRLTASGAFLNIETSNPDLNEQSIETVTCSPGDFSIQFKGNLLQGALPKFGGDVVKLAFTTERTPLLITEQDNSDYFALVMPSV